MPGRLFLTTPLRDLAALLGVAAPPGPEEPPRRNIAPGQEVIVLDGGGLSRMRWGMIPVGRVNARGRPVMETIVNARGETLFEKSAFAGTDRVVVPADGWYEWTGPPRRKTAWRIRRSDGSPCLFAAVADLWTGPGGVRVPQVALVTCAPGEDVAKIHDRMGVVLAPREVDAWLGGGAAEARALIRPLPRGALAVETADGVDWGAP